MEIPFFTFSNGVRIPAVGYGTSRTGDGLEEAIEAAVRCGYRQIDTAFYYGNEERIGKILQKLFRDGIVQRSDMFITTKLHAQYYHKEDVEPMLKKQLLSLQLDYIDLFLIHTPWAIKKIEGDIFPMVNGVVVADPVDHLETWRAMENVYNKGFARSIGLSNFCPSQINRIYDNAIVKPHNLQSLCHAYWPQDELHQLCKKLNIIMTAFAPLGSPAWHTSAKVAAPGSQPKHVLLDDTTVRNFATKYKKSPSQILLRWLFQRGINIIPKSVNTERIKENISIFDFELSDNDFQSLSNLPIRDRIIGKMDILFKGHPHYLPNECF